MIICKKADAKVLVILGCSSDLSKASEIAYAYVKTLGMNEELTLISASNKVQTSD